MSAGRGRLALLLAAVAATGLLAGCSRAGASPGKGDVTVGLLYPAGGPQGPQGTSEKEGAELAAAYVNSHGGIHGRSLRLVNVAADRAEAVPDAMAALQAKGVSVVIGSHGSAISAAAAAYASEHGQLFWETGAVGLTDGGTLGGTGFIRMAPMGANLGRAAIDFVDSELRPKLGITPGSQLRYAVAYVDDPYGKAVGGGAQAAIESKGLPLAGAFPYDASTQDFSKLASEIGAVHPDVLFVSAYLDDGVALRQALVAAHVPLRASIGTSSSYCLPAFGQKLGPDAVGLFASDKPDAADVRPSALTAEGQHTLAWVRREWSRRYHSEMDAPALSGFSNAYALFGHVLPGAASVDAAGVSAAALRIKLPEGTLANGGGMDIAPPGAPDAGTNRAAASVIWEWVGPGQRAVVWPPAFANQAVRALPLAQ